MRRTRLLALVAAPVLVAALLVGCDGGGSDEAASRSTTAAAPTTTTAAGPQLAGASDTCPGFRGATTSLTSSGAAGDASLTDATAGAQGCLDVVAFTFRSRATTPPGYSVGYRDTDKDPLQDGDPPVNISVPGAAHLLVSMSPALSTDPSVPGNPRTYTGNLSLAYGEHRHLEIVRELPDGKDAAGKDTVNWVIGLDSVRPFRVDRYPDTVFPGVVHIIVLIG
jgi:hypothetical protein